MKSKKDSIFSVILGYIIIACIIFFFRKGLLDFKNNIVYTFFFLFFLSGALILPVVLIIFNGKLNKIFRIIKEQGNEEDINIYPFSDLFNEYKSTFITNNKLRLANKTRTPAENFFNGTTFCEKNYSYPIVSIFKLISGSFVGLGILGTFIGFTNGLPDNLSISDIHELDPLFRGLKTAFNTSIIGVFSSIVYSFLITSPILKLIDKNSEKISNELDKKYYISDADLMIAYTEKDSVASITQLSEELTTNFENATRQSTTQIVALVSSLKQFQTELTNTLTNFSQEFLPVSENIKEAMLALINIPDLIEKTQENFIQSEKDIYTKLNTLASSFENSIGTLTGSYDTILNSIKETLDKINSTKTQIDDVLKASQLNEDQIGNNLKAAITQYESLTQETQKMLTDFKHVDQSIKAVFTQVEEGLTKYVTETNNNLTTYIDRFADGTKSYAQGFTGSCNTLQDSISSLESYLESFEAIANRMTELYERAQK